VADLTPQEKLQPCLLDRLTDDEPKSTVESRDKRVVSLPKYRTAVLRDIIWLLNTASHATDEWIEDFPEVQKSVVNYGIRDVCGMTISGMTVQDLEKEMAKTIKLFEPRIPAKTLRVKAVIEDERHDAQGLQFEIMGDVWANPLPESLYIKTAVDLETGHYQQPGR
jgi:type VI secretion system protein ImpF